MRRKADALRKMAEQKKAEEDSEGISWGFGDDAQEEEVAIPGDGTSDAGLFSF